MGKKLRQQLAAPEFEIVGQDDAPAPEPQADVPQAPKPGQLNHVSTPVDRGGQYSAGGPK